MGVRSDAKKLSKIWQLSKVHRDEMFALGWLLLYS